MISDQWRRCITDCQRHIPAGCRLYFVFLHHWLPGVHPCCGWWCVLSNYTALLQNVREWSACFFLQLWLSIYVTVSAWWPVGGVCSPIMPLRCETRCGSSQFFRDGFICANVTQLPLLKGTTHVRKLSNKCSEILIGIKVDMVCDIPSNDTIGRGLPLCKLYGKLYLQCHSCVTAVGGMHSVCSQI